MASNPQGIYARLKTEMKDAYYTDKMVENLENFRTMASTYLSGPGEYEDLPFLKICANLEGNGTISWNKLDDLKEIVASASTGKMQLLEMIEEAEREIQKSLSDSGSSFRRKSGAQQLEVKGEDMVVYMERDAFRVKETHAAFLECCVDPEPKKVVWKKGETTKVEERIIINNKKYFGAGPSSPTLVIRETEKRDEAYYQCTAKDIGIEVTGKAVPLEVDTTEERGSNIHGEPRSHSSAASGTRESDIDINSKLSPRSQDKHIEPRSWSAEDMHRGGQSNKGLAIQILMSSCQMMFTISNYNDVARLSSFIEGAFYAATGENKRIEKLDFEKKCIQVHMKIKAANSLSEAPAICLAEQFKHYILDVGLQLSEGSKEVLKVNEASIKITAEHMPEDGLPLVNISPQQGSVQHGKSVILQTYIVSSPPASSIEWFRIEADDHKIAIEINSKKYYGGTELSPSLIIRDVNVDDQGWYMCQATNNNGTGFSNKTFVRISSESTQTEDKPGTSVSYISDIQDYVGLERLGRLGRRRRLVVDSGVAAMADSESSSFETSDDDDSPSQPRHMLVTNADPTAMLISWKPPMEEYGSPVTEYIVEKQTDWIQVSKVPANKLSCVADNLIEGTKYRFRVTAVNKYGKGRALISDQTYMAKTPYELSKTKDYQESSEREISDIKDLVPIDVWGRAPSQTEIEKIVTLIDSKFSDLFLELGLPLKTVEEYGQGQPVTFQIRMKGLLRYWIDSFQTKATIGSLLTAMKVCQMDWHTAEQIWSAK